MKVKRKDLSEYQKWAYNQSHTIMLMLYESFLITLKRTVNLPIYILIGIVSVLHFIADNVENILYESKRYLEEHRIKIAKIKKVASVINCIYYLEDMERYRKEGHPLNRYWRYVPHKYFEKVEQLKK